MMELLLHIVGCVVGCWAYHGLEALYYFLRERYLVNLYWKRVGPRLVDGRVGNLNSDGSN